jgi:hypothetical protein
VDVSRRVFVWDLSLVYPISKRAWSGGYSGSIR